MKTFTSALMDIKSRRSRCDPVFLLKRLSLGRSFGHSEVRVGTRFEDMGFRKLLMDRPADLKKFDEGTLLGSVLQEPSTLIHSPAPLHLMLMNHCIRYGEAAFFDIAERVFRLCPDGVAYQFLMRSVERLIDLLIEHESHNRDVFFGPRAEAAVNVRSNPPSDARFGRPHARPPGRDRGFSTWSEQVGSLDRAP